MFSVICCITCLAIDQVYTIVLEYLVSCLVFVVSTFEFLIYELFCFHAAVFYPSCVTASYRRGDRRTHVMCVTEWSTDAHWFRSVTLTTLVLSALPCHGCKCWWCCWILDMSYHQDVPSHSTSVNVWNVINVIRQTVTIVL